MSGLVVLTLYLNNLATIAQNQRDTLHLPEFEIKANYILDNQGFKKIRLDSTLLVPNLNADLSTILSNYSTIFIKSYGNGTLATPSFRGTTAQHTQVEWNGINLNSPMLGQIDLSQIPISQFDGIEILYGAAGISRTSGAFGGVINLVTNPDWNSRFKAEVGQTIGSFDSYITNVHFSAGNNSFQSQTKFIYSSALNNFPYYNDYLKETVRQQNASNSLYGISEELFWKIKDKHLFSAKIWYEYNDRNLPPTTTVNNPNLNENQLDQALRTLLEYKFIEPKYNLLIRSAFVDQTMDYTNDTLVKSTFQYYSSINRIKFTYSGIRKLSIKPGIDFYYDWVRSDSYDGMKTRSTASLFVELNWDPVKKVKTSLIFREDLVDGSLSPFIPALGVEYRPFNKINLALTANLARNYRYPTLNDLYWKLSGNPDLEPETNYSVEMGTTYNLTTKNKRFFLEATCSGYYSWIFNLIIWTPVEGSSLWKPSNINEVKARGVEVGLNLKWLAGGFHIGLDNNYHFCRSTNEKAQSANDNKVGKQLIYIPVHTLNSTLSLEKWKFYLMYNFVLVSKRYTSTDNLSYMPGYNLSNIIFGKGFNLNNFILSLQVQINNLFNLDYQSVASRPMPGINYAFTIKLSFNRSAQ